MLINFNIYVIKNCHSVARANSDTNFFWFLNNQLLQIYVYLNNLG